MPAYDYSAVFDIYDAFCVYDGDIEFFQHQVESADGPVLELMAGTGRVSIPMLQVGADLTCIDGSPSMLSVLSRKVGALRSAASVICANVCSLPLQREFQMVVLPFQGFTEIVGEGEQFQMLAEVSRLLPENGRFVCTSHNPTVRVRTVDDQWREIGRFPHQRGETLVLSLKAHLAEFTGVVQGIQKIEILDRRGSLVDRRMIELEFSLVAPEAIIDMANTVGLQVMELYGDYQLNSFDEATSQCFVGVFERIA